MKTLQIGLEWFPDRGGGLDRYFYDCSHQLPLAKVEVTGLVSGSTDLSQTTQGKIHGFAPPDSSLPKRLIAVRKELQQILNREKFDLIVAHFSLYTFPVLDLIQKYPLVFHFHGPWALESDAETPKTVAIWGKKLIEKAVYKRACKFIVLSQTFRDVLHQEYQVPKSKITVVPGGVDIDRFNIKISQTEARSQLSWHQSRPTIFCIRRLAKRMGLENLVLAMKQVRDRYPDILLYIAGKGVLKNTLQKQIEELELTKNVQLLGYVSDEQLPLYYRAANFSVVPTVALEGFGLIVIESLAAGTPVLGTPVGGIPEILQPFNPDLVFEGYDPKQLARGILEALSGDRLLPDSQACLEYVRQNYAWQGISQKIELVYQSAIASRLS